MTSLTRNKAFSRALFIFSAELLLQAHGALASSSLGDAQAQARTLLNPPIVHHAMGVETLATARANDRSGARADAQVLARALLLGQSNESGAALTAIVRDPRAQDAPSHSTQDRRAYFDAQEAARLMIVGIGAPAVAATTIIVSKR